MTAADIHLPGKPFTCSTARASATGSVFSAVIRREHATSVLCHLPAVCTSTLHFMQVILFVSLQFVVVAVVVVVSDIRRDFDVDTGFDVVEGADDTEGAFINAQSGVDESGCPFSTDRHFQERYVSCLSVVDTNIFECVLCIYYTAVQRILLHLNLHKYKHTH